MSFRERSAWAMALVTGLVGLWYLNSLVALATMLDTTPPPLGLLLRFVIITVIASVVAQVTLAVMTPREAEAPADERERRVMAGAGAVAGNVLTFGLLLSMGWFVFERDGNLLFHMAFVSLIAAQVVDYLLQAVRLRRGE